MKRFVIIRKEYMFTLLKVCLAVQKNTADRLTVQYLPANKVILPGGGRSANKSIAHSETFIIIVIIQTLLYFILLLFTGLLEITHTQQRVTACKIFRFAGSFRLRHVVSVRSIYKQFILNENSRKKM